MTDVGFATRLVWACDYLVSCGFRAELVVDADASFVQVLLSVAPGVFVVCRVRSLVEAHLFVGRVGCEG